ncbi:sterol desaturase/sphingolipid hydroxylase (fatty acid hydroxylase superfamily) [Stella humosa]|uniref:Sterol desaturase/sphingolipid hydroxylase (Fatty acid hydroxylase superfamily) n=1 Tax=Stella humosa TaxID=94 RepID=A0A3N1LKT9_9PROT|nr:sterol desaturase family protein [Stella humosa]ROP91036.1 sterol desaturase/sphingolipid hydroxylase (fatty acid hydroxylase superfamily) [Stella humosa]BBK34614.1 sterol desaturase [Stella humosa]
MSESPAALLLAHEPWIRIGVFAVVLAAAVAAEALWPRRRRILPRSRRWPGNLGIVMVDTILVRLAFPVAAVGVALLAERHGFGLLNLLPLPGWLAIVLAVVALDLAIWAQHVLFHRVPPLWRLHRMHHADQDLDATTGVRFHPIEIALSMAIKLAVVAALGAPAAAVVIFEVLLNATAIFSHANLRLPACADRLLRRVVVTPDMHRVHHSQHPDETDSNFGFNLPWWDRLFGTYRAQPRDGHAGMAIGLATWPDPAEQRLDRMLTQPFRAPPPAPSVVSVAAAKTFH